MNAAVEATESDGQATGKGLSGLGARLRGGVGPAAQRTRPADRAHRDAVALGGFWPQAAAGALAAIREFPWTDPEGPDRAVGALTAALRSAPPLLFAVLYSPDQLLARLAEQFPRPGEGLIDSWIGLCWTAEAAWSALAEELPAQAGFGSGEAELLRPLAARMRFLVLSEPLRWRGRVSGSWLDWEPDQIFGSSGVVDRVFGQESWGELVQRCQQARRCWQAFLDTYQSHPLLSQAKRSELEQELGALTFSKGRAGRPLSLSTRPVSENAPLTAEDKTLAGELTERHLLPRFDVLRVAALAIYADRPTDWAARVAWGGLALAAGVAAIVKAALLDVHQAALIAAGCYALIGVGVLAFGAAWAGPWLLRLPAAAAVGVIALVSFLPGGWRRTPPGGWVAAVVLVGAACGYLAIEARNHGVEGWALLRVLGVTVIGAAHAAMISVMGLVWVAPAFVSNGESIAALWHRPGYAHAGMVLALAASWCLAVGVFSQILWDDRPITAPLAHLTWRQR